MHQKKKKYKLLQIDPELCKMWYIVSQLFFHYLVGEYVNTTVSTGCSKNEAPQKVRPKMEDPKMKTPLFSLYIMILLWFLARNIQYCF